MSVLTPSLEHAAVADAMHRGIVSCPVSATPMNVARLMAIHRIHCVFVLHEAQDDSGQPYLWGIVSDLDLMRAALRGDEADTAGSLAREPMITVKPTMPLAEATALMVKHEVSHLVVVDPETLRPVGVLSTTDVADVFAWGER